MAQKIILEVVTPERKVFSQEIDSLVVPATEGYLGVLSDHAPLVTGIFPGVLTYKSEGEEKKMAVSGGFLEVADNHAVLLADTAEKSDEINLDRAKRAKERAEKRLVERSETIDALRAEMALKRAIARIKTLQ